MAPCTKSPSGKGCPAEITVVVVTPSAASALRTANVPFSAQTTTRGGTSTAAATATWRSSDATIVTVTGTGANATAAAIRRGSAQVIAEVQTASGPVTGTATFTVLDASAIRVAPDTLRLRVGDHGNVAYTVDADVGASTKATWSTSAENIASVDQTGTVVGIAVGTAQIVATSTANPALKDTAVAVISSANAVPARVAVSFDRSCLTIGRTLVATATVYDASDAIIPNVAVLWSASGAGLVQLPGAAQATATITGVAQGQTAILATAGSITGSQDLGVFPLVASLKATLPDSTLGVGQPAQGVATPSDCEQQPVGAQAATWVSSNVAIASVSPSGLVTGVAPGAASITATVAGVNAAIPVVVFTDNVADVSAISAVSQPNSTILAAVVAAPSVKVTRTSGQPAQGQTVHFEVIAGGGTIVPTVDVITGPDGVATLTAWTLGPVLGGNTLTATVAGLAGKVVQFTADAQAPIVQLPTLANNLRANTPFSYDVTLLDRASRPMPGVAVAFAAGIPSGATFSPPQATTNGSGVATSLWSVPALGTASGTVTVGTVSTPIAAPVPLPPVNVGVVRGVIVQLSRSPTKTPVPGISASIQGCGSPTIATSLTTSAGVFDTPFIAPCSSYVLSLPVKAGVIREIRYAVPVTAGNVTQTDTLRYSGGNTTGQVDVCMTGPGSADGSYIIEFYDGSGGDGNELGRPRHDQSQNPLLGPTCRSFFIDEGFYLARVMHNGQVVVKLDVEVNAVLGGATAPRLPDIVLP